LCPITVNGDGGHKSGRQRKEERHTEKGREWELDRVVVI